jgi:hypothetical protein
VLLSIKPRQIVSHGGHLGLEGDHPVVYPKAVSIRAKVAWLLDGGPPRHPKPAV